MTLEELYLLTYQKFNNVYLPNLPDIIFIALNDDKELLSKLLNVDFKVDQFIDYLVDKKNIKKRTQILESLEEFINKGGKKIEFRFFKQ